MTMLVFYKLGMRSMKNINASQNNINKIIKSFINN